MQTDNIPFNETLNRPFNILDPLHYSWEVLKKEWRSFIFAFLILGTIYFLCIILCILFLRIFVSPIPFNWLYQNGVFTFGPATFGATGKLFPQHNAPITLFLVNACALIPYAITQVEFAIIALQTYDKKPITPKKINFPSVSSIIPIVITIISYQMIYSFISHFFNTSITSCYAKIPLFILIEIINYLICVIFGFYIFFIIERKSTITRSLKQSYQLAKKYIWLLIQAYLVILLFWIAYILLTAVIVLGPLHFILTRLVSYNYIFSMVATFISAITTFISGFFFLFTFFMFFAVSSLCRVFMYKKLLENKKLTDNEQII